MRLTDLNPRWVGAGGPGISQINDAGEHIPVPERDGVGIGFDCPCGCGTRCYVDFKNPVDGGPQHQKDDRHVWNRVGEDFETLTLTPSILRKQIETKKGLVGCGWHGFITDGGIRTV